MIRDEKYYLALTPDPVLRAAWRKSNEAAEARDLANWEKWEARDIAAGIPVHSTPEWVTEARAKRDGWQVEARARILATAEPDNWLIEARARLENAVKDFRPYVRLNGDGAIRA